MPKQAWTMQRRDFLKTATGVAATIGLSGSGASALRIQGSNQPSKEENFPKVEKLTARVAEFVVKTQLSDIPSETIELGKKSILDGLGLALSGSKAETAGLVQQYVRGLGCGSSSASVLGSAVKMPARFAALANGIAIHVDDYDDTQLASAKDRVYGLLVHPTVCVLPAALATAEVGGMNGKELLLAYQLGVEVECKIAEAISPRHYEDGFHTTGTCGVFGGTSACARLKGLDAVHTARAFAIAASQASGLRENFGTMMKPFQAGHATESGVVAADFAALGWTGAEHILEAERGFFHAYGGTYDPEVITERLGKPWTLQDPGISIKPFPSGSLTHPGMTELLRLIRTNSIRAADVAQVEVGTNHNMLNTLIHHRPTKGLQAKFSMEFCMAILLLDGKADQTKFTDAVANRPDVQEMIGRVRFYTDPEAEKAGYDKMTTILKITLKDGRIISGRADFGKGSPSNPMSYDEVAEKFLGCAAFAEWPTSKANRVIGMVRKLEDVSDVRMLTALVSK
ncbi:MAG TPA: MmgE/PrpD family protein [Candidatus Sulfotelmatobacter sp.]|nr:MmgE/PrpD family protein [Candidatus Sulfotelmatobacter sp.]